LQILPAEKQAEVFDFVEYLSERFSRPVSVNFSEWTEQDFAELAMNQAMRGLEDESVFYTEADIKERW
jgi:hypothetical protein